MSISSGNTITDWKRLWRLVSGIHYETPEKTVLEELLNVSKELQDGLLQFRTISASQTNLEDLLKEKKQEKLLSFTLRLQELLDLESKQCWEILCYYLANEYRGSAGLLTTLTSTETNMSRLLDDIWGYYTLERMIVLKIVKNMLVFFKVPNHPYQREYKQVLDKITLQKLRDSYLQQLEHLINEAPPSKITAGEYFNFKTKLIMWSERNAREINEVLHILLLLCEHLPMTLKQVEQLFSCFRQHAFGKQQRYLNDSHSTHAELLTRLTYSEVVLFLKCIDFEDVEASKPLACDIIKALDKYIARMYHNPENGPLLFAWMLLNLRFTDVTDDEERSSRYRQFGKRAMDLNCFRYLHELLDSAMFKDDSLVSRIARRTIYNLLSHMCDFFDGDGSCARHPYVYELLCELLSWPTLAKEFCKQEDGGVRSLYNTLLEIFPLDFLHLSMLASALTKAGMSSYIKPQLEALPILTDIYDEYKYALKPAAGENEYILLQGISPYPRIDFSIPPGTTAVVTSRPLEGYCLHLRTELNYFNALHHEINCLLVETAHLHGNFEDSARVWRVNAGLRYLVGVLQHAKSISAISAEMVHPTEMCIDLLHKFKTVQFPPLELMANCLRVCTALLPLVDVEIFTRVINLQVLPVLTSETVRSYKQYAQGEYFDSCLVGSFLVNAEKKLERYDFLLAYLSFLRTYTRLQRNRYFQVEIPGLIFLLREVFPQMHAWRFKVQADKHKIYAEIMGFICDILDIVIAAEDQQTPSHRQLLRDICVYSLLNSENGLMLLRFVALGNAYLQHTMEMESNWMHHQSQGMVLLVRLAMRILMQLLRLKSTVFDSACVSPLEALIYTQPKQRDTLRIIPVVTSYMSNIFDRWLPILACRLLKRIALEFNMSLLACLDMEPDQIRLTFLQKLPDELESDSLKIAILELVEACIERQPGVTEAFFKVNYAQEKRLFCKEKDSQIGDSILTFLEDYLEAVEKEPQTVEHALPGKIMNLFHSLWKQNLQVLVQELVGKPKFWEQLCNPLFYEPLPSVRAYTQLLNILAIEIFCSTQKPNQQMRQVVQRFFAAPHFERWLNFVLDIPKTPAALPQPPNLLPSDELPEWLCRLEAFKGFLLILLKKQPQFVQIPASQAKLLAERCMEVLVARAECIEDLRPFILLAEMYLLILLSFKQSYTESPQENSKLLQQLLLLLNRLACCYEDLHVRAKEACLSITIKCADLLAEELLSDTTLALQFLHSVVSIICSELQNLENCVRAETAQHKAAVQCRQNTSPQSLILSLNLLTTVATIFHCDGPGNWDLPFISNKVFQRLLSCTASILQMHSKQQLSVELLDVLIVFAKGNCSVEFLHCDVGDHLWLKLLPPKDLLQVDYALVQPVSDSWTVQKWWPIYTRGIELASILFEKHSNHFLKEVLQFVGIHETYLCDSLLLCRQSLEPLAMSLIKTAITLVAGLVKYEKQWRLEHSQSLFSLMRAVQLLLGHSISMFHQPKNLKCLVVGRRSQLDILRDSENAGLVDEVITAFNNLTEIIILCSKCLQRFSPNLLELICAPEFSVCQWEPIFEIHFGLPKLSETAITLTFGAVLSIVGVYTKVLNLQNYGFHDVPLNVLPCTAADGTAPSSPAATATNTPGTQLQRPFSKSLSITSVSSANCPPNELLSNLDGELCLMALEHILTLAASQSLLALKNAQLPLREKQLIKREISSELISYHEFVRKKVLVDYREHKEIWHRRKHGQVYMLPQDASCQDAVASTSSAARTQAETQRRPTADLRVNVVRRLHLQHQQQQQQEQQQQPHIVQQSPAATHSAGAFEMSHVISPIGAPRSQLQLQPSSSTQVGAVSSTPHVTRSSLRRPGEQHVEQPKRVHIVDEPQILEEEDELMFFPPEEPKYSPLSYVALVEEDYLHFMSNLFTVICQSD